MKGIAALVGALAAFIAVPAAAADSSQQDIECAAWAAYTGSFAEDEETDQTFAMAFSYFLGRYEASTELPLGPALTAALEAIDADAGVTYERYNQACMPLWESSQERIGNWSAAVEASAAYSEAQTAYEAGEGDAQ